MTIGHSQLNRKNGCLCSRQVSKVIGKHGFSFFCNILIFFQFMTKSLSSIQTICIFNLQYYCLNGFCSMKMGLDCTVAIWSKLINPWIAPNCCSPRPRGPILGCPATNKNLNNKCFSYTVNFSLWKLFQGHWSFVLHRIWDGLLWNLISFCS